LTVCSLFHCSVVKGILISLERTKNSLQLHTPLVTGFTALNASAVFLGGIHLVAHRIEAKRLYAQHHHYFHMHKNVYMKNTLKLLRCSCGPVVNVIRYDMGAFNVRLKADE